MHRGIGWQSAAAAIDAVIQDSLAGKASKESDAEGGEGKERERDGGEGAGSRRLSVEETELLQTKACKASILAKLALRSSLLARQETSDIRRGMSQAVELQLERIQSKVAEMLGNQLLLSTLLLAK